MGFSLGSMTGGIGFAQRLSGVELKLVEGDPNPILLPLH
jgi:hypothetical protein